MTELNKMTEEELLNLKDLYKKRLKIIQKLLKRFYDQRWRNNNRDHYNNYIKNYLKNKKQK